MKKSNIITLLFLCISIIAVMLFMKFKNAEPVDNNNTEISQEVSSAEDSDNDKTEENYLKTTTHQTRQTVRQIPKTHPITKLLRLRRLNPRHHQNLQTLQWMTLYL